MIRIPPHTACLVLVAVVAARSVAAAAPLDLAPDKSHRNLAPEVSYLADPHGQLTLADVSQRDSGAFAPIPGDRINFGFSSATFWLRLPLVNSGAVRVDRLLAFNMRFMQELDAWLVSDGAGKHILANNADTPFGAREVPYRFLTSRLSLAPGQHATLFIRYFSEGTTALPLSIETQTSFIQSASFGDVVNTAFYVFVLFMFIYSLMYMTLLRVRLFFYYALYLATVTFYVLHMDGLTFQYLWPNWPRWNSLAALPLGVIFTICAAKFSQEFLETRRLHPRVHVVLAGVMVAGACLIVSPLFIDASVGKRLAFPFTVLAALIFLGAGINAYRSRHVGVRFYVIGWSGITVAALVSTFLHWFPGALPVGLSFEVMRVGILVDGTMMALAIMDRLSGLRRERDAVVAHESVMQQELLDLHDRFLALENSHAMAIDLANSRGRQLTGAGHDLRQPLGSLRAAIQDLQRQGRSTQQSTEHVRGVLNYLEGLVADLMRSATDPVHPASGTPVHGNDCEVFPIQLVLDNVRRMFANDVRQRGLALRSVSCNLKVRAEPLVVMRIVANLVSNALKYTTGQRVLLGCRRRPDAVTLVVLDQGPGIAAQELERLIQPGARGDDAAEKADGSGLGLAIVADLARRHGYAFRLDSDAGRGTVAAVTLTRA